jgi:hypothetical protein
MGSRAGRACCGVDHAHGVGVDQLHARDRHAELDGLDGGRTAASMLGNEQIAATASGSG